MGPGDQAYQQDSAWPLTPHSIPFLVTRGLDVFACSSHDCVGDLQLLLMCVLGEYQTEVWMVCCLYTLALRVTLPFTPPIMEKQLKDGSMDFQYLHHLHVHFFQKLEDNSTWCVKHLVLIEGIGATVQLKWWHESSDWESKTETNLNMQKQKMTSASRQERILRIEYFKYVKVEWSKTMPSDGPTLHWRWTWSLICEISASLCGYDASRFTAGSRHWNDADSLCTC